MLDTFQERHALSALCFRYARDGVDKCDVVPLL